MRPPRSRSRRARRGRSSAGRESPLRPRSRETGPLRTRREPEDAVGSARGHPTQRRAHPEWAEAGCFPVAARPRGPRSPVTASSRARRSQGRPSVTAWRRATEKGPADSRRLRRPRLRRRQRRRRRAPAAIPSRRDSRSAARAAEKLERRAALARRGPGAAGASKLARRGAAEKEVSAAAGARRRPAPRGSGCGVRGARSFRAGRSNRRRPPGG